ncbi:MAG TPA: hypothetical protein VGB65_03160 [Allosphingosinicella sp.]|jgi:hypothetical protein
MTQSQEKGGLQKPAEETVSGCRGLAEADLGRAALADTTNGRGRLEASAASWNSRADMIQEQEDSFEERRATAEAEWADGEEPA